VDILIYIVVTISLFSVVWIYFISIMSLKKKWDDLAIEAKVLAAPHIVIGFALDILLNLMLTPIFLELPHELTLSSRVKRHRENSTGWRLRLSDWICETFLLVFDNFHC